MLGTLDFIILGYCWLPSQFFPEHSLEIAQVRNPLVTQWPVITAHFFCLQCSVNGVKFEKLQKGSGKNVKSLEMFFSGFPKIIGMENFPSLQSLTLMGQQITMLENLECLPNLTELCVSESKLSVSQFLQDTVHCMRPPPPPLHGLSFQYSGHVQLRFCNPCIVFQAPQLHYGYPIEGQIPKYSLPPPLCDFSTSIYHITAAYKPPHSFGVHPPVNKNQSYYNLAPSLACIELNSIYYDILKLNLKSVNAKLTLNSTAKIDSLFQSAFSIPAWDINHSFHKPFQNPGLLDHGKKSNFANFRQFCGNFTGIFKVNFTEKQFCKK